MSALPALVESLGPGVIDGLARSARMLRDDAEALDALAATALQSVSDGDGLDVSGLLALPRAIRTRVIRAAAIEAGASTAGLTADHVHRVEALVADWHGQGPVDLPGGLVGERRCERLSFHPVDPVADRRRRHRKE
jgi:tRNA(Ile)-lysidine synthase